MIGLLLRHLESLAQGADDFSDEGFGRRCSGGDSDRSRLPQPIPIDVPSPLNEARRYTQTFGDFGEAQRIAAVRSADHQHPVAFRRDGFDGCLAIGGCIANVLATRRPDIGEASLKRLNNGRGIVDRKGGLGKESEIIRVNDLELPDILDRLD